MNIIKCKNSENTELMRVGVDSDQKSKCKHAELKMQIRQSFEYWHMADTKLRKPEPQVVIFFKTDGSAQ